MESGRIAADVEGGGWQVLCFGILLTLYSVMVWAKLFFPILPFPGNFPPKTIKPTKFQTIHVGRFHGGGRACALTLLWTILFVAWMIGCAVSEIR